MAIDERVIDCFKRTRNEIRIQKEKKNWVGKEKVCTRAKRPGGAYPGFYSMKRLGTLLLPLGCNIPVDHKVTPKIRRCSFIILGMRNIVKRKVFCPRTCTSESRPSCLPHLENNILYYMSFLFVVVFFRKLWIVAPYKSQIMEI